MGSFIQSASNVVNGLTNNPNTIAITMSSTPVVGRTIYVGVVGYVATSAVTITATDNQTPANTYTRDVYVQNTTATGHAAAIFSCPVTTASGSYIITVSITNSGTIAQYARAIAAEFSGPENVAVDRTDANAPDASSTTEDTTATATTTYANALLLALGETQDTLTKEQAGTAPASGWTSIAYTGSPTNANFEYQFVTSTVAARQVWLLGSSQTSASAIAAYKDAAQTVIWVGYIG